MWKGILALLIFSASGCGIMEPDKTTINVAGTVTAEATGQPIVGAEVDLFKFLNTQATTTTDSQGRYSISQSVDVCFEGDLGIGVGASGTGFVSKSVQISCTSSSQHVDFSLVAGP